jgi:hypothetical protein
MMRVLAFALVCLAIGNGCSKSQPEPSESGANPELPKADAPAQVTVALAPASGPIQAARPATAGPDCEMVCEPVRKLGCRRASECVDSCRQMADGKVCRGELMRFYACLGSEPAQHWECLDDGTGAIKEGFCEREQSSFAACLEKSDVR